jgi:ABC-type proline/glycine betaine transport system ATPase subunit
MHKYDAQRRRVVTLEISQQAGSVWVGLSGKGKTTVRPQMVSVAGRWRMTRLLGCI